MLILAVVVMQLIYFLVKSTKDRLRGGNTFLKSTEYVRGYILIALLIVLLLFMLF
ncbi:hypothetical protein ACX0HA_11360 [Flavobacterium hauense]